MPTASVRAGPAAGQYVCRELRQRGADQGAGQHVAGVVHAGMDARVSDQRGERAQRYGGRRRHVADAGRERERSGGVPGRKRARARHPHMARERDVPRQTVGASPPCEWFDGDVDHGRRDPERSQPLGRRAAAGSSPGEREQRGGRHGEARVVGGAREAAHRDVERRRRGAGNGGVDREIQALGVLDPTRPALRGFDVGAHGAGIV